MPKSRAFRFWRVVYNLGWGAGFQCKARLPPANQLEIDLGKKLGIQQRPVLGTGGIIDIEASAQRVEAGLSARVFLTSQRKGVDHVVLKIIALDAPQFGVKKSKIEFGVVNNQPGTCNKIEKGLSYCRKQRHRRQELIRQSMDSDSLLRHVPLGT